MGKRVELFAVWSDGWDRHMPVSMVYYESRENPDLHIQTGDHHADALNKAEILLGARGWEVGDPEFIGPTGMYYPLRRVE